MWNRDFVSHLISHFVQIGHFRIKCGTKGETKSSKETFGTVCRLSKESSGRFTQRLHVIPGVDDVFDVERFDGHHNESQEGRCQEQPQNPE
jgi:hypothetical protein